MNDSANVQKNKLTAEQKKLINASLTTHIGHFQEYRLDQIKPDGAIFFEYLCYNSFKLYVEEQTSNGYFYHSYARIEQEYGIGKDRVKTIIAFLKQIGVVETKVCGFPKNTHYRIRFDFLAVPEILVKLFRTTPARTKEIAARYVEMAKIVKLREETNQEILDKQYPSEASWFKHLKKVYYKERARFNKTVSPEWAIKKVQPNPREQTYRNISSNIQLVFYDLDGRERSQAEKNRRIDVLTNGFQLYCAMLFFFISSESSKSNELRSLIENNEECVTWIVNYASGIRDPIAYFFAQQGTDLNWIYVSFLDAADKMDFTTGYFSN